jgi:hypothetical protein
MNRLQSIAAAVLALSTTCAAAQPAGAPSGRGAVVGDPAAGSTAAEQRPARHHRHVP